MSILKNMHIPSRTNHLQRDGSAVATAEGGPHGLYKIAGVAALVQLGCTLMTILVVSTLGGEPGTADEYFTILQNDRRTGILRMDFASLVNVTLFAFTSFALYAALRAVNRVYTAFATALVFTGIAISLATHSAFSLLHLSDQFAAATSDLQRANLLAAGEAIIASDWWHSTGGFMAGLFLQGGMVLLSSLMLASKQFSKWTAYLGILANGLDWVHILVGLFLPWLGTLLISIGGLFYLAWFPLLGRDLFRLSRGAGQGER